MTERASRRVSDPSAGAFVDIEGPAANYTGESHRTQGGYLMVARLGD